MYRAYQPSVPSILSCLWLFQKARIIARSFTRTNVVAIISISLVEGSAYVSNKEKNENILFFDTETTGLLPGNICQITYLMLRKGELSGKNIFFQVDYVSPKAQEVHGFSKERLRELSKGRTFKDWAEEIYNDFQDAHILIGHNVNFDVKFLTKEFERSGMKMSYKKLFCTMRFFEKQMPKRPKLSELGRFLNISDEDITHHLNVLFRNVDTKAHDARFDTILTYLCWREGMQKGFLSVQFPMHHHKAYLSPKMIKGFVQELGGSNKQWISQISFDEIININKT